MFSHVISCYHVSHSFIVSMDKPLFRKLRQLWFNFFMPNRRFLTESEKQLARQIFGQQLQLDAIQIVAHRCIVKGYAMSPNGNIYFNPKDYTADFSVLSLSKQGWLIHELVHVWQLQQGVNVLRKAIFDRRYDYAIQAGKAFVQYGIEQQASMVQDYFMKSRQDLPCDDLKACIPFLPT